MRWTALGSSGTYHERSTLLLVSPGKECHVLHDLDTCVIVDVDAVRIILPVRILQLADNWIWQMYVHSGQRSMDGCAANLDRDRRIEDAHGGLERLQPEVLVWEDAILAIVDAESDTDGDVVFVGAEPGVTLCLLEDVVEECVVAVVIHRAVVRSGRTEGDYGARTTLRYACGRGRRREGKGRF